VARDKATHETRQAITWNIAEGAITAGDNVEYAAIAARDGLVAAIVNNGATTTVSFYGGTEEPKPYDLNQDGSVDVSDVTLLVAAILADEEAPEAFDLNQDGSVDVSDVTELVNYILSDEEEAAEDPAPVEP
ncbi:MAG: dockerin type I repeat-containing protein, partial [Alloprevotella sp.]|nr:dockerin type I repeat-containing protein [Alloprevotella sp.]